MAANTSATSPHPAISYRSTTYACYIGYLVLACVVNLAPVLFIPLREAFGLSYQQLGALVLVNFVTQVTVDIAFSKAVDRYGYRPFIVTAHALTIVGFALFASSPLLFDRPYVGFVLGTVIFSGSGGLLELLVSPIVNAIPKDENAAAMSLLHSFYAWGQVAVVLLTTLFLWAFGKNAWRIAMLLWTAPAWVNVFLFAKVPLAPIVPEEHRQGIRALAFKPFFLVAFCAILLGGASEIGLSQWSSAFMERALGLPKVVGDVAGMSMFGAMLGIGRALHAGRFKHLDLNRLMILGACVATACYLVVALTTVSALSLAACALCGMAVSLMWPGTLVLAADRFPLAGTWLFAILAAGGDIGCSVGPWLMGLVTDATQRHAGLVAAAANAGLSAEQMGLRTAMLVGTIFPLGALICQVWLASARRQAED